MAIIAPSLSSLLNLLLLHHVHLLMARGEGEKKLEAFGDLEMMRKKNLKANCICVGTLLREEFMVFVKMAA